MQQQGPLRQQQLIPAGQSPIAQQQQPQQATQRELVVTGTAPGIMQSPQQLQTTGASGTWITQQAENAGTGRFIETSSVNVNLTKLCNIETLCHIHLCSSENIIYSVHYSITKHEAC